MSEYLKPAKRDDRGLCKKCQRDVDERGILPSGDGNCVIYGKPCLVSAIYCLLVSLQKDF
ncbi:hypothetical protein GF342_04690 [Candidatus Woesearchaeota archaeon]|nr:hypothetical protein [Candidatus Woesearchaeota archaeon]